MMRYPQIILIILAGITMVGQGSRMIVEGIMKDSWYQPNTFDIFFDWTTLAVIGFIMFSWGIFLFYRKMRKRHELWDLRCPNCGALHTDDIAKRDIECPYCHTHGRVDRDILRNPHPGI